MISTASNTVTATITGPANGVAVAFTPDGKTAYVPGLNGSVSVISTASNTITGTIPVGDHPDAVAVTPDGSAAYVINRTATPSR